MTGRWVEPVADAFWEAVESHPAPPRDVEPVVPLFAPVSVVALPAPRRADVADWMRARGFGVTIDGPNKPFLGFVVAFRGGGAVFVDGALPAADRRVIVAHEFAHYVHEYDRPRQRVVRRLGPTLLPVLDGDRPPTAAEEWGGVLAGVTVGVHVHHLARGFDPGRPDDLPANERAANELALELLAPRRCVLADFPDGAADASAVKTVLVGKYGLPPTWAAGYAGGVAAALARRRTAGGFFGG